MNSVSTRKVYRDGKIIIETNEDRFDDKESNDYIFKEVTDEDMKFIELKMEEVGQSIQELRCTMAHNFKKHIGIFEDVAKHLEPCQ